MVPPWVMSEMKVWICILYEGDGDGEDWENIDVVFDSEEKAKEWKKHYPDSSDYREYEVE